MHKKKVKNKFYYYTTRRSASKTRSIYLGKNFSEAKEKEKQLLNTDVQRFNWKAFSITLLLFLILGVGGYYGFIEIIGFGFVVQQDSTPPLIDFVDPTPANGTSTVNTSIEVNISITETDLGNFTWNWNGTNYTMYDNESLLLMFNFDNVSALGENNTFAVDVSQYGSNGTGLGGANYTTSGKYGGAFQFGGADGDYMDLGSVPTLQTTGDLTLELWANYDTLPDSGYVDLISQGKGNVDGTAGSNFLYLFSIQSDKTLGAFWEYGTGTNVWNYSTVAASINSGEWHHYIMVRDTSTSQVMFYVDGAQLGSSVGYTNDATGGSSGYLQIGAEWDYSNNDRTNREFDGSIDEVRVWNRTLSADEINQSYMSNLYKYDTNQWAFYTNQSLTPDSGLVDGSYTYFGVAQDSNGNENMTEERTVTVDSTVPLIDFIDPTPANATTTSNTSIEVNVSITEQNPDNFTWNWNGTNYSFYDDDLVLMMNFGNVSALGENDTYAVDVSQYRNSGTGLGGANYTTSGKYDGGYEFDGSNTYIFLGNDNSLETISFTAEAWVKLAQTAPLQWGIVGKSYDHPQLVVSDSNYFVIQYAATDLSFPSATSTTSPQPGVWYHVAGVWNTTTLMIYVNGVLENSEVSSKEVKYTDCDVTIGAIATRECSAGIYAPEQFFNGTIDEVRIWNRSLSADEINQSYMSNLHKYDVNNWEFYSNQSLTPDSGLPDGDYTYFAHSKDVAGNENMTEERTVSIDSSAPLVLIVSPTATTYTTSSVSLDYVAVDASDHLDAVWYTKDSGVTNTTLTQNITLSSLSNADYTLILYANDTVGNLNETNVTFTVSVSTTTTTTPSPTGGGSYSGAPSEPTSFSTTTSINVAAGEFVALSTAQNVRFTVKGTDYIADLKEISKDFVRLWVHSPPEAIRQIEPIEFVINMGKRANVDLDNDNFAEVNIELRGISNGYAFLYFKETKSVEKIKMPEGQKVSVEEPAQEPLQMPKLELLPKIGVKTFLMMVIETFESWIKNLVQTAVDNKYYSIPIASLMLLLIILSFVHFLRKPRI